MNISKIFIAGFKYDIQWTRACVASIRFQYPEIPIFLIKDKLYGNYSTTEIEKNWNVSIFETNIQKFGWGLSKLEPLFLPSKERILIIDSDIVIVGKLLEWLDSSSAEFVVRGQESKFEFTNTNFYDLEKLEEFDSNYVFKEQGFCSGHIVATTGIFNREDFNDLVNWDESPPTLKNPEIFRLGEQGMINYFLYKKHQIGTIRLDSLPFMEIGDNPKVDSISIEAIKTQTSETLLIHWGGIRKQVLKDNANGEILHFFENIYYEKITFGGYIRHLRPLLETLIGNAKKMLKTLMGRS